MTNPIDKYNPLKPPQSLPAEAGATAEVERLDGAVGAEQFVSEGRESRVVSFRTNALWHNRLRTDIPLITADMTPRELQAMGGREIDIRVADTDLLGAHVFLKARYTSFPQPIRLVEVSDNASISRGMPLAIGFPQQGIDLHVLPPDGEHNGIEMTMAWAQVLSRDVPLMKPIAFFDDVMLDVVHGKKRFSFRPEFAFATPHLDRADWITAATMDRLDEQRFSPQAARAACLNMRRIIYGLRARGVASAHSWPFAIRPTTGEVVLAHPLSLMLFDAGRWARPRMLGEEEIDSRLPFRHNLTAVRLFVRPETRPPAALIDPERNRSIVMADEVHGRGVDRMLRIMAGEATDRPLREQEQIDAFSSHLTGDVVESLRATDYHPSGALVPMPRLVVSRITTMTKTYLNTHEPDENLPLFLAADVPEFIERKIFIPEVGSDDAFFDAAARMYIRPPRLDDVVRPQQFGLPLFLGKTFKA